MSNLLKGIKVLELAGLAPVPHCGMILADFGADVTVIDKKFPIIEQRLTRGKTMKTMDLRSSDDLKIVREMCSKSDVLLDPFRPGVLEKIGLDPLSLLEENEQLVICRITGYGQKGRMSRLAGHDINYVGMSGMLPILSGTEASRPWPPANLLADFAGGGLTAAFGIVAAIHARSHNGGKGCVLDCSMSHGVAYLSSFIQHYHDQSHLFTDKYAAFGGECPIYRTYKTKDDKYMAVGALEPKFYQEMFKVLNIDGSKLFENPESVVKQLEDTFLMKNRDEWVEVFEGKDCCVTPVLDIDEVSKLDNFEQNEQGQWVAKPAPRVVTIEDLRKLQ